MSAWFDAQLKAVKGTFFDRQAVMKSMDATTRQVLSKFGAYVRQRAKTSIKKKPGSSPPGKPPHSHVGTLRRFIFFGYDMIRASEVVGPILSPHPSGAPKVLEYGGRTVVKDRRGSSRPSAKPAAARTRSARPKKKQPTSSRVVQIAQRAYMHPAMEKELPGLPQMWKDSVRATAP